MTFIFYSCAQPVIIIIALPGNLPGTFPDLPGLRLFDKPGNATRNGGWKRGWERRETSSRNGQSKNLRNGTLGLQGAKCHL